MNREIKFRAWDGKKIHYYELETFVIQFNGILGKFNKRTRSYDQVNWELMQYTGLKDKNGKERFEDDIVLITWTTDSKGGYLQSSDAYVDHKMIAVIKYYREGFAYFDSKDKQINFPKNADIEVIGNVYENPELL